MAAAHFLRLMTLDCVCRQFNGATATTAVGAHSHGGGLQRSRVAMRRADGMKLHGRGSYATVEVDRVASAKTMVFRVDDDAHMMRRWSDERRERNEQEPPSGKVEPYAMDLNAHRREIAEAIHQRCCFGDIVIPGTSDLIVIISATMGDDPSWLLDQPHEAHIVSDFESEHVRRHQGYEAGNYLRYIIDNYDRLPKRMAFLHSHRTAWEMDDEAGTLRYLDGKSFDFMGLSKMWALDLRPYHIEMTRDFLRDVVRDEQLVAQLPAERFNFSFASGGSFLVSAERVRLHSKSTWESIFKWLQGLQEVKSQSMVLEFSWHMLFGEHAQMKPPRASRLCPEHPQSCLKEPYVDPSIPEWRVRWYTNLAKEAQSV